MARTPKAWRTRGGGAGARLDVAFTYYRAPDGLGRDFGTLSGKDADGRWEFQFEGDAELDRCLQTLRQELRSAATEAREDGAESRGDGRAVWLKAIGAADAPPAEIWWDERDRAVGINFPYRPRSIRPDDLLVVYAAGTRRIVGVLRVTSPFRWDGAEDRWPWRMDTEVVTVLPLSEGVPLDGISEEREIGKSIRQKSHIRLSDAEAERALEALGALA